MQGKIASTKTGTYIAEENVQRVEKLKKK